MLTMSRSTIAVATAGCLLGAVAAAPTLSAFADSHGTPTRGAAQPPVQPLPPPQDFVTTVDNPHLPFVPGMRWVYRAHEDGERQRIVDTVLHRTRSIEGIDATVVHDVVRVKGEVLEDTFDWYGQDTDGNVWYLGEATKEYADNGSFSTEGSWEAGKHGAHAGIAMPAHPVDGQTYRQEYRPGVAEDLAKVVDQDSMVRVPFGFYRHTWLTEETTPLEPRANELKFYARGIGVVEEDTVSPRPARTVLVSFRAP
jgi:hypothetical protein